MRYAVFGCGNQLYGDNFNTVGKVVDARIAAMGARQLLPVGLGNEDSNDMEAQFDEWCHRLLAAMQSQEGLGDFPILC
jgi:sulfite reductase alpha subunit-like flavoprotein